MKARFVVVFCVMLFGVLASSHTHIAMAEKQVEVPFGSSIAVSALDGVFGAEWNGVKSFSTRIGSYTANVYMKHDGVFLYIAVTKQGRIAGGNLTLWMVFDANSDGIKYTEGDDSLMLPETTDGKLSSDIDYAYIRTNRLPKKDTSIGGRNNKIGAGKFSDNTYVFETKIKLASGDAAGNDIALSPGSTILWWVGFANREIDVESGGIYIYIVPDQDDLDDDDDGLTDAEEENKGNYADRTITTFADGSTDKTMIINPSGSNQVSVEIAVEKDAIERVTSASITVEGHLYWETMWTPATKREVFTDVVITPDGTTAFAVGYISAGPPSGILMEFDNIWKVIRVEDKAISGVDVSSDGQKGFAVGTETILKLEDGAWSLDPFSEQIGGCVLHAVAVTPDGNKAIAVGTTSTNTFAVMLKYEYGMWNEITDQVQYMANQLHDVAITSDGNEIYAVGRHMKDNGGGVILYYDGSSWSKDIKSWEVFCIDMYSETPVKLLVGGAGYIKEFNGAIWITTTRFTDYTFRGAAKTSDGTHGFMAISNARGLLLQYDGESESWGVINVPGIQPWDVDISDDGTKGFAVGFNGQIRKLEYPEGLSLEVAREKVWVGINPLVGQKTISGLPFVGGLNYAIGYYSVGTHEPSVPVSLTFHSHVGGKIKVSDVAITVTACTTNPLDPDTDGDGLNDTFEISIGSDPNDYDTDGDSLWDGWHDANKDQRYDSEERGGEVGDPEGGGGSYGTNPWSADSDLDYMSDPGEMFERTDPRDPFDSTQDMDNDGLNDYAEFFRYNTIKNLPDTDGDGVKDGTDPFPLDPTEWLDTDGDGKGNTADTDDDNDGLSDTYETSIGTGPLNPDTDGDTWDDGIDEFPLDPNEWLDTDEDGIGDNADPDDDNDGFYKWGIIVGCADYDEEADLKYSDNAASDVYNNFIAKGWLDKAWLYVTPDPNNEGGEISFSHGDGSWTNVEACIDNLKTKTDDDDIVVFYFAGHGMNPPMAGPIFTDGSSDSAGMLTSTVFEGLKCRELILIIDACYASTSQYIVTSTKEYGSSGRCLLASEDGPDSHDWRFTHYLLTNYGNKNYDCNLLYNWNNGVYAPVNNEDPEQNPQYYLNPANYVPDLRIEP